MTELLLSQFDQPQIHHLTHQIVSCASFFHCDFGWKCLKRPMLENRLKQIAMRDSTAQNSSWICYLHSVQRQKATHISFTEKLTEWPTAATKNDNGAKCCLRTERWWQKTCRNWATIVCSSIWEPMMKPITETCFCHDSCCLPYVMSLARLYFRKQYHNI